jgi:NitT/TauT family transport system ATP-binding protein
VNNIPALSIQNVSKKFGNFEVLQNINLEINNNEIVAIIGHSGCGKTTLLRIVCAFEKPDFGSVFFNDKVYEKPSKDVLMIFQSFEQLQPWRTVLGNVVYPLIASNTINDKKYAKKRAIKRLEDVGLSEFLDYYPHTLSGGMKQRVAIARALALATRILVLDEPFASLDDITRRSLQKITKGVCKKHKISVFLVTHSIEEALIMSDKIVIMDRNPGRIKYITKNNSDQSLDERNNLQSKILMLLGES